MKATISQLISYPIKSCAGIAHQETTINPMGLSGDRQWMLVDSNGLFLSQRKHPQMALIQVEYTDQVLTVNAPGMKPLNVDLMTNKNLTLDVTIWKNSLLAEVQQQSVNQWFSDYLRVPVNLVRYGQQSHRPVDPDYAKKGETVAFADGYPLLIVHEATLIQLNQHLSSPVTMNRFRPNIVVSTESDAWDELNWRCLTAEGFQIDLVKPCARCVMTGIDQSTGQQQGTEVLKTLKQQFAHQNKAVFGINGIARVTELDQLKVGQSLQLHT